MFSFVLKQKAFSSFFETKAGGKFVEMFKDSQTDERVNEGRLNVYGICDVNRNILCSLPCT